MAEKAEVVICGAGPAGMAAALSMARLGYTKIIILERCSSDWEADWIKSYCYNINHHGLKWFRGLGLEEVLAEAGVPNATKVVTVSHKGVKKVKPTTMSTGKRPSYWIKRQDLMSLLRKLIQAPEMAKLIDIRFDRKVVDVSLMPGGGCSITVQNAEGNKYNISTPLLIGATGSNCVVEKLLKENDPTFKRVLVPHINAGRHFKALRLRIPEELVPGGLSAFLSGKDGSRIGVFPQPSEHLRITGARLKKLDFTSTEDMRNYLKTNYPQVEDWDSVLEEDVAAKFVSTPVSYFPEVEYVTRLQAPSGTGGACLVGDAVHVGPPDLGQGVNAALEDVFALYEAFLKGKASGSTVAEMLARYEEAHLEDAKAIGHLQPIGVPYQYGQPMSLHKAYCMADLLLRLKMNKYFPTIFSAPVIYLLQDPEYSYSDCLKAYHATSTKLLVAFSGAVVAVAALVHWWHS